MLTNLHLFTVVLNERQRTAKRRLIEENRERRKEEQTKVRIKEQSAEVDTLTDYDRGLICEVVTAYEYTSGKTQNSNAKVNTFKISTNTRLIDVCMKMSLV